MMWRRGVRPAIMIRFGHSESGRSQGSGGREGRSSTGASLRRVIRRIL
jgi:hypothetical protein